MSLAQVFSGDHICFDTHVQGVPAESPLDGGQGKPADTHMDSAPVQIVPAESICVVEPIAPPARLADSLLAIYADALDDMERTRISQENRVRALRQCKGMADSPEATRLDALVDQLKALEHGRVLELQRAMRAHPLGSWQKAQCGIGAKQLARLLACIDDPYWHRLYDRPRSVSELWAFCGLHVFRLDHQSPGAHFLSVGAESSGGDPDHASPHTHSNSAGVAARSMKGHKSNWSAEAKSRAYLIATSCVMHADSPYRLIYDERRLVTADRCHCAPCPRCGPSGHPVARGRRATNTPTLCGSYPKPFSAISGLSRDAYMKWRISDTGTKGDAVRGTARVAGHLGAGRS